MSEERSRTPLTESPTVHAAVCCALACAPFAYLVVMLLRYHLDAPYLDQWEFVPLLAKSYEGTLSLHDLWAQHNEHRIIFPRLIMLGLARLSHWNIAWELATNLALAAALFLVLVHQLKATERRLGLTGANWLIPVFALLLFSMSQWRNWFLGWQLQELLNVLAVVAGFVLLADTQCRWGRFIGALGLGVVATYSFANGLAYWPIALLSVIVVVPEQRRMWVPRILLWLVVGGIAVLSYVHDYHAPDYHSPLSLVFERPVAYAVYVLAYLGSPIDSSSSVRAVLAAVLGLAVFFGYGSMLIRGRGVPFRHLAPYASLGLYAIASALMTGVGRLDFGTQQALSSRYVTIANLLWAAVFVWAYVGIAQERTRAPEARQRSAAALLALLVLAVLAGNSLYASLQWSERYTHMLPAQAELMSGDDPDLLQRLHPDPDIVLERREILRKYKLSVFRENYDPWWIYMVPREP